MILKLSLGDKDSNPRKEQSTKYNLLYKWSPKVVS